MKHISLKGSWIIKAPLEKVYEIITDFENMPKYFPAVTESVRIISRKGNNLKIEAKAKSFGKVINVKMNTKIYPLKGFVSDNESDFGTAGHEEFMLEEVPEGTKINYSYEVEIKRAFLRIFAKPLIGWYAMKFWKRSVIDKLKELLEK